MQKEKLATNLNKPSLLVRHCRLLVVVAGTKCISRLPLNDLGCP